MAPLPKRRHSSRRGGKREAAWLKAFTLPGLVSCPQCAAPRLPHRVCKSCGWYDGKTVIVKREKKKK
ncbi:50S ribosomal protein L32 [Candidatus Gottesmanbacteria bacterium]|nr:50S ribosomal protein L32 [Candidatus Gottesmanbacteria bacterium]MBI3559536.1 50S ribosomal protein L32 [Candidatus Gottesmanbacteria bacterium]